MDANNTNKQIIPFLKLKNDRGEDVYSIDRFNETLIVSPLKQLINIFEPLTLYGSNDDICSINMSTIFIDTLIDSIEKNENDGNYKKMKLTDNDAMETITSYMEKSTIFRKLSKCFTADGQTYIPPDGNEVLSCLEFENESNAWMKKSIDYANAISQLTVGVDKNSR